MANITKGCLIYISSYFKSIKLSQRRPFRWKSLISKKFGNVFLPIADLEIKSESGEWKIFYPEIDTGAIISVFSANDCERLGYTLTDGDYFDLKGGLGGISYPSWIHELDFRRHVLCPNSYNGTFSLVVIGTFF
jgi:hypothetical protein